MGGWFSSDAKTEEQKLVDANGVINYTFVTNDSLQTHNPEIIILLAIIAGVQVIQLLIYAYNNHTKKLKKNYKNRTEPTV